MSQDPVVIYSTPHLQQAHLLQQTLLDLGIETRVETPAIPHQGLFEYSESTRVVVRRQDADEARRIAIEFDQLLQLQKIETHEPPMADSPGEIIEAWPQCSDCSAPRMAECLTCGEQQDFFPSAYQQEGESHNMRFCRTCDDVAELRYCRRCHRCGHDYGDGYEPPPPPPNENESRALLVLFLLVAGGMGLASYFYFLFRR
jgi:hypothetical protein